MCRSTGGIYDLVAFDPRGTANTIPFNCSSDPLELIAQSTFSQVVGNASDVAVGQIWAGSGDFAKKCFKVEKDIGEFVGTASVARDLMSVVDALDEDGMLRYYGECD